MKINANECHICKEKEWIGFKNSFKYSMLVGTIRNATCITSKDAKYMFGVKWNDIGVCIKCFEALLGLENYFGKFWHDFIQNEQAKKIVINIVSNPDLLKQSLEFRSKGKYIPTEIIEEALSFK